MHILVIRTSAMGDVALLAPVVRSFRSRYPDVGMTLVTRKAFEPFFYSISGLDLFFPDFEKKHKGIPGLIRLFFNLKSRYKYTHIVDLHGVMRSRVLGFLFLLSGISVRSIKKGRSEKRKLIKGKNKVQLKHTVERYCDVFGKAGFAISPGEGPWIIPTPQALQSVSCFTGLSGVMKIGVAPFAKHELKTWPAENMIRLLGHISGKRTIKIFLFGGKDEAGKLKLLSERADNSVVVAGHYKLDEEIAIMSKLDLMIAMDSANMHMAALTGTRVISIWGATDPLAGFGAWNQPDEYSIRIPGDELTCRPCTVYGKGECLRGDFACMHWMTPERVFKKLVDLKII